MVNKEKQTGTGHVPLAFVLEKLPKGAFVTPVTGEIVIPSIPLSPDEEQEASKYVQQAITGLYVGDGLCSKEWLQYEKHT